HQTAATDRELADLEQAQAESQPRALAFQQFLRHEVVAQPGNTRLGESAAPGELRYTERVVVWAEGTQQRGDACGRRHIVVPLIGTHALSVPHQRGECDTQSL